MLQGRSGQHIDLGKLRAGMCQPAGAGWWRIRPRRACWRREGKFRPAGDDRTFREQLVVTNAAAWAAISEKNNAMLSARLAVMAGARRARSGGLLGGFGAPGVVPGSRGPGVLLAVAPGGPGLRGRLVPQQTEAEAALRKAVGNNAPEADIQAALVTVRAEHKAKKDAHAKAQDVLRGPLNPRQEAQKGEPRGL